MELPGQPAPEGIRCGGALADQVRLLASGSCRAIDSATWRPTASESRALSPSGRGKPSHPVELIAVTVQLRS